MPSSKSGRPFTQGITEALLLVAERIMVNDGYSSLTIDALAAEVGTTRPTFYRRFPSIAHLALEVIKTRFGTGSPVDTGSLYSDLLTVQRDEIAMFSSPLLRKNLSGLLEAAREDVSLRDLYRDSFIGPRRGNIARIIRAAVERDEVKALSVDIDYVCDQLLGPIFVRALLPVDAALDDGLARQTAETAVAVLRRSTLADE